MSNILITGGLGYIGAPLAKRLMDDGHNVTLYDSLFYGQTSLPRLEAMLKRGIAVGEALLLDIEGQPEPKEIRFVKGDTRDKSLLQSVFRDGRFDYVFHFGELVGNYRCRENPELTRDINFNGTKIVVNLALSYGAALVYNSSSSVYGENESTELLGENASIPDKVKKDPYCLNKLLAELHISRLGNTTNEFRFVILRPATVGGLSPRMRLDLLPNQFTYDSFINGKIKIADSTHYRAVIDLNDLIDAYVALLRRWNNGVF